MVPRSTSPYMTIVFHARLYNRFTEIKSTFRKKNFVEQIKVPIYLEAVFVTGTMQESQSNLEEKDNYSLLKINGTSIAPALLDWRQNY